ncbi:MAG: hypothetical protein WCL50_12880 [Spirochaetota bacterium]
MTTILLALGRRLGSGGASLGIPAELLPLAGRPLIQRYVEFLADSGRKDLAVVLRDEPERFSTFLEEGERWGVRISYHRCDPGAESASFAAALFASLGADEVVDPLAPFAAAGGADFPGALGLGAYLDSAAAALSGSVTGFVPSGRESSPGIRQSHHVRVHPSARLVPPVYIGDSAEVGAGAVVGPFASLERGSVVGRDTVVRRSVLLPWTIVGEGLTIEDFVVEGAAFFKPSMDASYVSGDPAISSFRPA